MDDTDKVNIFYEDCKMNGIAILPPDINQSAYRFIPVDDKTIRYGLGAVKGTGEAAISVVIQARERKGDYQDLFDFCQRIDRRVVNRRVIEALIRAGAFDAIDANRAALMASVGIALEYAEQRSLAANQVSLFDDSADPGHRPAVVKLASWTEEVRLQHEKMALGFYISGHPYESYAKELSRFIPCRLNRLNPGREPQLIAGVIYAIRTQMTRRGKMAIVVLDDGLARIEVVVYNDLLSENQACLKADQLLVVKAMISHDGGENMEQRVVAKEIYDYTVARSIHAKKLSITINDSKLLSPGQLKELLSMYCPASNLDSMTSVAHCPVSIRFRNQRAICDIELDGRWRVSLHEQLIESLAGYLGKDCVEII